MHAAVKARESEEAAVFGSTLQRKVSKSHNPSHQAGAPCARQRRDEWNYQTLSVCEGFTALSPHAGGCIWPSPSARETERLSFYVPEQFALAGCRMSPLLIKCSRLRLAAFMFFIFSVLKGTMCSTLIPLLCSYIIRIQGTMTPTLSGTRTEPRLGGRSRMNASQKIWSSDGGKKRSS